MGDINTTREQAERAMDEALAQMPPGWSGRVWENMGWHFRLVFGPVMVYEGCTGGFSALIAPSAAERYCGFPWAERGSHGYQTPMEAVRAEVANYEAYKKAQAERFTGLDAAIETALVGERKAPAVKKKGRKKAKA